MPITLYKKQRQQLEGKQQKETMPFWDLRSSK